MHVFIVNYSNKTLKIDFNVDKQSITYDCSTFDSNVRRKTKHLPYIALKDVQIGQSKLSVQFLRLQ